MVHSLAEEEVLYPEFKNMMGSKCRDHALSEHMTLKNLLMDLDAMTIKSPGFKVGRVNCVHDALPPLLACTDVESHCCASLHPPGNAAGAGAPTCALLRSSSCALAAATACHHCMYAVGASSCRRPRAVQCCAHCFAAAGNAGCELTQHALLPADSHSHIQDKLEVMMHALKHHIDEVCAVLCWGWCTGCCSCSCSALAGHADTAVVLVLRAAGGEQDAGGVCLPRGQGQAGGAVQEVPALQGQCANQVGGWGAADCGCVCTELLVMSVLQGFVGPGLMKSGWACQQAGDLTHHMVLLWLWLVVATTVLCSTGPTLLPLTSPSPATS